MVSIRITSTLCLMKMGSNLKTGHRQTTTISWVSFLPIRRESEQKNHWTVSCVYDIVTQVSFHSSEYGTSRLSG
jgi:hypothetical protein